MKAAMKNRTRTLYLTFLVVLVLTVVAAVLWHPAGLAASTPPSSSLTEPAASVSQPDPAPQPSKALRQEIQRYAQAANADGIVTETPDPYFIKKQSGYDYRAPETISYSSSLTHTTRHAMIFLPADYSEEKTYPVLYLLHGYGGSHRTWRNKSADILLRTCTTLKTCRR